MISSIERKSLLPVLFVGSAVGTFLLSLAVGHAQQSEDGMRPPLAQIGDCYVNVTVPAQFKTVATEERVREGYEYTRPINAQFNSFGEPIVVKESFEELSLTDAEFRTEVERIEVQAAQQLWTSSIAGQTLPANPDTLEHITDLGVTLDSAPIGTCYAEYFIDDQFESVEQQVLVQDASEKIILVPAVFETIQERVEVKAAYSDLVSIPSVFRTESEKVLVEPARDVWRLCSLVEPEKRTPGEKICRVSTPERFETLTKTVQVSPPSIQSIEFPAVYEMVDVQRLVESAKEIREQVPAVYETITKRVRVAEAEFLWLEKGEQIPANATPTGRTVCREEIPAQYVSVERMVISEPSTVVTKTVPAAFDTVAIEKLVSPASQVDVVIPAASRTVDRIIETLPSSTEWHKVLCKEDSTPDTITAIQTALLREGFNPGPIDGVIGRRTLEAAEMFQTENGLGLGGITIELMELLEVETES